jgi:hypothetical protein
MMAVDRTPFEESSGLSRLCLDLQRLILELVAQNDKPLALELVAQSSVCKAWFVLCPIEDMA